MATAASVAVLVVVLVLITWGRFRDVLVTAPAALLVVLLGLVDFDGLRDVVHRLGPTLVFLAAILVVGEVARGAGVFTWLGDVLRARADGSPARLVVGVSLAAIAVTAVMSLDATAVLLTPVVVLVVRGRRTQAERDQPLLATAQLATAASGFRPV